MIRVYCVGIHFDHEVTFKADTLSYVDSGGTLSQTGPKIFMSGQAVLKEAAEKFGLRYKLADSALFPQLQHVEYLSYTPTPVQDRIHVSHWGQIQAGFSPFNGQPLSLIEQLAPIGEISRVIQYTVQWQRTRRTIRYSTPVTLNNTGRNDPSFPSPVTSDAAFGSNGFPDHCEIRLRLLSIFCTS